MLPCSWVSKIPPDALGWNTARRMGDAESDGGPKVYEAPLHLVHHIRMCAHGIISHLVNLLHHAFLLEVDDRGHVELSVDLFRTCFVWDA